MHNDGVQKIRKILLIMLFIIYNVNLLNVPDG